MTEKGDHQNVARAALVIETLSAARESGLRMTDVVEASGLGSATVHRLLAGLVAHGFVDFDKLSNRYFVGLRMLSWTASATERYGLLPYADAELERLCSETEDTVYFSLMSGFDSVCVDRREGTYPIKTLTLSIGDRRPLGVGAGSLALLAFQPESEIERVLNQDRERRAMFEIPDTKLEGMLAATQKNGFSLNEGNLIPGMSGVGVAIKDARGRAVAAISVAAITTRLSGERLQHITQKLHTAAENIEQGASAILSTPLARRFNNRAKS